MTTTPTTTNAAPRPPKAAAVDVDPSTRSAATIVATDDFSLEWLTGQHAELLSERQALTGQANRLEDEANSLLDDGETGDVKFDDEGAEGDGMAVERDRDLMLSAQARESVVEIDAALERMAAGTYGYSVQSGRPIPRERLEAIPWATLLVEEKRGGIGSW
jgi:RNA polymerase-binding transcription factor DksA